jgi:hypothetical protein
MTQGLRQRFEMLLRHLPEWENPESRHVLLRGILREREVWDYLQTKGSVAVSAGMLLDVCEERDLEALCVVLDGLREIAKIDPEGSKEIEFLRGQFCGRGAARRRGVWEGVPYKGLNYFDKDDSPIFFGREAALQQLVQALNKEQGRRFAVVMGASGSGKSSLVRAGLWAGLEKGEMAEMAGSRQWLISAMTPTDAADGEPKSALRAGALEALRKHGAFQARCDWKSEFKTLGGAGIVAVAQRVLAGAPAEACWLVILDQMEELFAQGSSGTAFLDELIEATHAPTRLRVVATLRADFYQHCHGHPALLRLLNRDGGTFHLGAPDRRGLEQMVSGPLTQVEAKPAWVLDDELPAAIAADAERHAGGLALMAFALRELYEACREARRMDLATYRSEEFGGLGGVIARRAEKTMEPLGESGAAALGRVFARLVRVNEGAATRRRERRSAWVDDAEALKVVDAFERARLLVADRGAESGDRVVEVAHEALLREWPRLARWIEERKEAFALQERVRTEAQAWANSGGNWRLRRPWPADLIEEYRKRLETAGLLGSLLEDDAAALLLTPEVEWLLREVAQPETGALRRWEIGKRLAEIGDPRPGVGVKDGVPDILWRPISGGTVEIEKRGSVRVEPFQMAAYPITIAQFRAFVDAPDGYGWERWWKDLEKKDGLDQAWQSAPGNHPVTDVNWYDAAAFCRWLSEKLGKDVRLPDEQEWQQAAQSERVGFAYPWGPDWREGHANTAEADIKRTTAVGMFPQGDSLQQVSDLAGNVWEWCRNEYEAGQESRVLRGGSWGYDRDLARAGFRYYYPPHYRSFYIGFRVVVLSPIRNAGRGTAGH